MKKYYLITCIALFTGILSAQPTITSFSPTSGAIGTTVTIMGTNFNSTTSNNSVYFGGTKASVSAGTTTSLTVTVPLGATFDYLSVTNLTSNLTAYSSKPFQVSFSCNVSISSSSFSPKVDFLPGSHPVGIAMGDIDGDGKLDMVVANAFTNNISVLLNTSSIGTISFAAKVDFAVGSNPWAVALGDLDGDGKLDMAVANGSSSTMSVLRNTSTIGTPSFAAKIDYSAGTQPYGVAIGDLDADGKPEVAIANFNGVGTVSVYKNASTVGSLAFASATDFTTGSNPKGVAIGDMDGDGKPDLSIADYNTSTNKISVLRNTSPGGSLSFAAKVDYPTGTNPYCITIGDVDGDGKTDIAVPDNSDNTFSVFRNTCTSGTISFAARVSFPTGNSPVALAINDLDGDGKLDFAVTNQFSNTVSVYKNTSAIGAISFGTKVDFTTGTVPYSVALGDLDGDQRPDIATANATANNASTFKSVMCPVGIESFDDFSSDVSIYPNPFTSQTTIEISDYKNDNFELHIYDVLGKEILKSTVTNAITLVERGELPSGIYFLKLSSNKGISANKKIIIR